MTVHLKMTGQIFVVAPATPSDRHLRLVLPLADGREIRFRDVRKFGRIGLYRLDRATGLPIPGEAVGVLGRGAEPLAEELTPADFVALVGARRGRLKTLLLNQDFLAGVGNIYADEALWVARLHPLREARSLRREESRRLFSALREVLAEAVERRGSSIDDYTAPEGDGSMQEHLRVYQRAGEPCLRCGRPIRRFILGGRSTHFCPWCQRLPADQRASVAAVLARAAAALPTGAMRRVATGSGGPARRGTRWTELSGERVLGRTGIEEAQARARRSRAEASRRAAAARRAAARSGISGGRGRVGAAGAAPADAEPAETAPDTGPATSVGPA